MTYNEVLDYLYSQLPMYQRVGASAYNKDLSRTLRLLEFLDNPHQRFKSVHIAGTNGKGSTAHLLASILSSAGYKTGLHTSPHLKSFTERIKVDGTEVDESFVVDFVERVQNIASEIKPSFFEMTVAMAYEYFAQKKVDIAIIETGMGGRLDSTNVITPELAIITSISMDHQVFLGDTYAKIAIEKAGIIKEAKPVVLGNINEESGIAIEEVAKSKKAEIFYAGDYYHVDEEMGAYNVHRAGEVFFKSLKSDLLGDSVPLNLPVVLKACDLLIQNGFRIDQQGMQEGIEWVCQFTGFKGRWQQINGSPATYCDIGHNVEAVRGIVDRLKKTEFDALHIVWGMASDKDVDSILSLLPKDANYYFCAAQIPRALAVDRLLKEGKVHGLKGQSYDTVNSAYHAARQQARKGDFLFVGGSAFVVAELDDI